MFGEEYHSYLLQMILSISFLRICYMTVDLATEAKLVGPMQVVLNVPV